MAGKYVVGHRLSLSATPGPIYLYRRTWDISERAEHTTVAGVGLQLLTATRAVVEVDARVCGHLFGRLMATVRASQSG